MWTLLSLSLWFSVHIWTFSHCPNEQGVIYITWGYSRAMSWWSCGTAFLTISFVLDQVLAFKELARWIISFTNSTSIQCSFGTKFMITPYLLQPKGTSEGLRHKGIWRNSWIFHKGVNCPLKKIDIGIVRNLILSYFTYSINANIIFIWRTQSSILHFAGHCKEKVKVFSCAVQFTSIFLWEKTTQKTRQESISRPAAPFVFFLKNRKRHLAIVSSCILDECRKLQGLIVCGDILGPQDGQK